MTSSLPTLPLRGVENTLRRLLADMRTVVEARCSEHGLSGPAANAAAGLLPFVGVEIIAVRTTQGETRDQGIRRVFGEIAQLTSFEPYARLGFPLFKLVRHGLAHGFWPNEVELPNSPKGTFSMMFDAKPGGRTICVDQIGDRAATGHLQRLTVGGDVILKVNLQHLARDVSMYIDAFCLRLCTDHALQTLVEQNDVRVTLESTNRLARELGEADIIALGL